MKATGLLRQSRRRSEAELSFMLAGQALARWNFRLAELQQLSGDNFADGRDLLLMEAGLGAQQMASLAERMQTFSRSTIEPIRFQAQEMLVAVARIEEQLSQVQQQLSGQAPVRPAEEIAAALLGRAKRGSRSRPGDPRREDAAATSWPTAPRRSTPRAGGPGRTAGR